MCVQQGEVADEIATHRFLLQSAEIFRERETPKEVNVRRGYLESAVSWRDFITVVAGERHQPVPAACRDFRHERCQSGTRERCLSLHTDDGIPVRHDLGF